MKSDAHHPPTESTASPRPADRSGFELTLGQVLDAARIPLDGVLVIRHTYKEDGLRNANALTGDAVRAYTRGQLVKPGKFPQNPPRWWVVFMAEPRRRARLYTVYENSGEAASERTAVDRFYDLRDTELLADLRGRLLIEWTKDAINWAKTGSPAWSLPVLEIPTPASTTSWWTTGTDRPPCTSPGRTVQRPSV